MQRLDSIVAVDNIGMLGCRRSELSDFCDGFVLRWNTPVQGHETGTEKRGYVRPETRIHPRHLASKAKRAGAISKAFEAMNAHHRGPESAK